MSTSELWIQWIQEAIQTGETNTLQQLLESTLHCVPTSSTHWDDLLNILFIKQNIGDFCHSPHLSHRRWLLDYLEILIINAPMNLFAKIIVNILCIYTQSENTAICKRVISVSNTCLPILMSYLLYHSIPWESYHEELYSCMGILNASIGQMYASPNESVRTHVIKYEESLLLLFSTKGSTPSLALKQYIKTIAMKQFTQSHIPGNHPLFKSEHFNAECTKIIDTFFIPELRQCTNLTTLLSFITSIGNIMKQRREFINILLPTIIEIPLATLPPLSDIHQSRLYQHLKSTLYPLSKLKSFDPYLDIIYNKLDMIGMKDECNEIRKLQQRQRDRANAQQSSPVPTPSTPSSTSLPPPPPTSTISSSQYYDRISIQEYESTQMKILIQRLYTLPVAQVSDIVFRCLDRFVIPTEYHHTSSTTTAHQQTELFIQLLATLQEAHEKGKGNVQNTTDTQDTARGLSEAFQATTLPSTSKRLSTSSFHIPIPYITSEGFKQLGEAAFKRIWNINTEQQLEQAGTTALLFRMNILIKLISTSYYDYNKILTGYKQINNIEQTEENIVNWQSSYMQSSRYSVLTDLLSHPSYLLKLNNFEFLLKYLYSLLTLNNNNNKNGVKIEIKIQEEQSKKHEDEELAESPEDEDSSPPLDTPDNNNNMNNELNENNKRKREQQEEDEDNKENNKKSKLESDNTSMTDASTSPLPTISLPPFSTYGTIEYNNAVEKILTFIETQFPYYTVECAKLGIPHLYSRFLVDLPLLLPSCFTSLDRCVFDSVRSIIGLTTIRDIIINRTKGNIQTQAIHQLLAYTHAPDNHILRDQSIRLIVNKLYTIHNKLNDYITIYAQQRLEAIKDPATLKHIPEFHVTTQVPEMPIYENIEVPSSSNNKKINNEGEIQETTKMEVDTATTSSQAPTSPSSSVSRPSKSRLVDKDAQTRAEIEDLLDEAQRRKKEYDRLVYVRTLALKIREKELETKVQTDGRRKDLLERHMELYLAICTKQPILLNNIFDIYQQCTEYVQQILFNQLEKVLLLLGPSNSVVLDVLQNSPPSSERLVLLSLTTLCSRSFPSPTLIQCAINIYNNTQQIQMLMPVLPGLSAEQLRRYLPKFLTLPTSSLSTFFTTLITPNKYTHKAIITPTELMITLHILQGNTKSITIPSIKSSDDKDLMKHLIISTKILFEDKLNYTQEVLIRVIARLVQITPIPKLLFRTFMQTLNFYPSSRSFLLPQFQLINNRNIHMDESRWEGYLGTAQLLLPLSLPVLTQLPDHPFSLILSTTRYPRLLTELKSYVVKYYKQCRKSIREIVMGKKEEQENNNDGANTTTADPSVTSSLPPSAPSSLPTDPPTHPPVQQAQAIPEWE